MAILTENSRDVEIQAAIVSILIDQGYGTYARRFKEFDLRVTDMLGGHPIEIAAMSPATGEIAINPGFFEEEPQSDYAKKLWEDRVSLVIRHEILHFLLVHEKRLIDHLKATDPDFEKTFRNPTIQEIANIAMDWDLSREGYNKHDQEVAKNLAILGRVVGGLVLEEDKPEWMDKTMEQLFDALRKDHDEKVKNDPNYGKKPKLTIKRATHSQEYIDEYNKIMAQYDDARFSDGDIEQLIADTRAAKVD